MQWRHDVSGTTFLALYSRPGGLQACSDSYLLMESCSLQLRGKIAMVRLQQQRVRDLNSIQPPVIQTLLGESVYRSCTQYCVLLNSSI